MVDTDTSPRDITTDHETIREWVENRGGTPAHTSGRGDDDASSLYIVREDEEMEGLEPISWDDFFETFEAEGLAFVHQDRDVGETDEWLYDLIDREEVAERASLETTDVEEALLEGDVVRSEITETKVIEKTVVETDQIESQVVDSEIIERNLVDRETISREIVGVSFEGGPDHLTPRFRSESTETTSMDSDEGMTETTSMDSDEGMTETTPRDTEGETGESRRSPVDEPADETTADPPVDRPSPDREEVDRTATSEQSSQRTATGQEPGDRRTSEQTGDRRPSEDPNYRRESNQRAGDREMVDHGSVDRDRSEEPTVGLGVDERVTIDVHDTVRTTTEVFERKTVESRVTEQEITEADSVESDAINIQGVEETILESDLIEGEIVSDETGDTETRTTSMPSGAITSEQTEGDTVHSQFVERRLIETESTEHHHLLCDITDHTLADIIDSRSTMVERAIVDREAGEEVMLRQPEAGMRTTDEQITAAEGASTSETTTAEADAEMAAGRSGDTGEAGMSTMTDITDDEIGKQVVSGDREVGIVSEVDTDANRLYVDPEPSMTDKIKAALDWGDTDDSYPVDTDQIEGIDDDEVRIREV
jgi:hypothetical protein